MDFNYGTTTDISLHKLYRTVSTGNGSAFVPGQSVTITVTDLLPATYYWSMVARNNSSGKNSGNSDAHTWVGPSVSVYDPLTSKGGVQFSQTSPSAMGQVVRAGFDVTNGVYVYVPVAVTSRTFDPTAQRPVIIPGATIPSTDLFAYANGTATTTAYYAANSTGPWTPAQASQLLITDGDNYWWKLIETDLSAVTLTTDEYINTYGTIQVYSDTPNTVIQICQYGHFTSSPTYDILQTQHIAEVTIGQVFPHVQQISINWWGSAISTLDGFGYYIRNTTLGSNVTVYTGSLFTQQLKK